MKISDNFIIKEFDTTTKELIVSFWENRGIDFYKKTEKAYTGRRGNIFWNFVTFNMHRLATKLYIIVEDSNEVRCELDVNTIGQFITRWNKEYWKLELETFKSVLLNEGYKEKEWVEYNKTAKGKNIIWMTFASASGVLLYSMYMYFS